MIIEAPVKPVSSAIIPGELLLMRRSGKPVLMIALHSNEQGQWALILNIEGDRQNSMRRKVLNPSATWGTFGVDWFLELRAGPELGTRQAEMVEQPGVISLSRSGGAVISTYSDEFDRLYVSLESWESTHSPEHEAQVYPSWAIWRNSKDFRRDGGKPIYDSARGYLLP